MVSESRARRAHERVHADRFPRTDTSTRSVGVRILAVGGVLLSVLTGCSPALQDRSAAPRSSASAVAGRSTAPSSDSAIGVPSPLPHDRQPAPGAAQDSALEVAVAAMRRFCRPTLSGSRWNDGLDPLLTVEAASVYATVDPTRVGCTRVVPPVRLVEGDGFTQVVTTTTDGPLYRVTLSRSSLAEPWLVFRITPAAAQ